MVILIEPKKKKKGRGKTIEIVFERKMEYTLKSVFWEFK